MRKYLYKYIQMRHRGKKQKKNNKTTNNKNYE